MEVQKTAADAPKTVAKSAVHFFLGTILSRFSGFFREVALGAWFGASPILAGFFVAYRFSQLLRRVFGESALLASFSPHYEHLRATCPEQASAFFRDLGASLVAILGGTIIVLETALFAAWNWGGARDGTREILLLTMIMLPGVLFVCLYALFSALLQTDRRYFLPSMAPLFFNLIFLIVLWCVKEAEPEVATVALAIGITFAFLMQWMSLVFSTSSYLREIRWREVKLWTAELKKMVAAMSWTLVGIGAVQINSFIDTLFARTADLSGPAYLYYAIRLYQLPLALFGLALSSALLPPLARARLAQDSGQFLSLLQFALRRSLSLMIPMTVALLVLGEGIVNVIYGRGVFDLIATIETTYSLWGYALGLVPSVLILLLAPAFYAKKDFKTPLKASLTSVSINFVLNTLLVYGLEGGSASIAVSTSLAACANAGYLWYALKKQEGALVDPSTRATAFKILACSLFAGLFTLTLGYFFTEGGAIAFLVNPSFLPRALFSQIAYLAVHAGMYSLFFFFCAWAFKIDEVFQIIRVKK